MPIKIEFEVYKRGEVEHPFFHKYHGFYSWCFHCERVLKTSDVKKHDWICPFCGAGPFDIHTWKLDDWPRVAHPEYPVKPVLGKRYPLYS